MELVDELSYPASGVDDIVEFFLPGCVIIRGGSSRTGDYWMGSGFVIGHGGDTSILTCAHVVSPGNGQDDIPSDLELAVSFNGSTFTEAELIYFDDESRDLDIAVISIPSIASFVNDSDIDIPFCSSSNIDIGDPIAVIGSPEGIYNIVVAGVLSSEPRKMPGLAHQAMFVDVRIFPGNSGGPVFSVEKQGVIGIARGSIGSINYVIPSDAIMAKLDKWGVSYGIV